MEREMNLSRIPVNIYRTNEQLMVSAAMPGLLPQDVTIEVSAEGQLTIHGDLRGKLKGWKDVLLEEWQVGNYHRELTLSDPVDGAAGHATLENGVLVVVLPIHQTHTAGRFSPMDVH